MEAGPRTREEDELSFSRIVAFSDGVFAIAITLLVLQINVPEGMGSSSALWNELKNQSNDFVAYGISFAVIGRFWVSHHRYFSSLKSFDSGLLALNLAYLAFVVLIPYTSQVLGEYSDDAPAVIVYAANLAIVTLIAALMATYVLRVEHNTRDGGVGIRRGRRGTLFATGVFCVSMPIALLSPTLGQISWALLFFDPSDRQLRREQQNG